MATTVLHAAMLHFGHREKHVTNAEQERKLLLAAKGGEWFEKRRVSQSFTMFLCFCPRYENFSRTPL